MTPTREEWRPVVGYEGLYEVSDHGRVRSLDRMVHALRGFPRRAPGRVLQPAQKIGRGLYLQVNLCSDGKQNMHQVHALVLSAFVGPRPPGYHGCHNDGDSQNNHLSNLRWDTPSGNARDTVKHGKHATASRTACPRGHLLVEPNLKPSRLAQGMRECRACARARSSFQNARRAGRPPADFDSDADAHYQRIMSAA